MHSNSKAVQSGRRQRTLSAIVNTVTTLSNSRRGSSLARTVITAARSDAVSDDSYTSGQQDARQLAGNKNALECIAQSGDDDPQVWQSTGIPISSGF